MPDPAARLDSDSPAFATDARTPFSFFKVHAETLVNQPRVIKNCAAHKERAAGDEIHLHRRSKLSMIFLIKAAHEGAARLLPVAVHEPLSW